MSHIKNQSEDG